MPFIKLHFEDVEALIKLIEDQVDTISPAEKQAYNKLLLMREAMRLAYANRTEEQKGE